MVKAKPPATIAPDDMPVWVTLISFNVVLPNNFNTAMESTATKIVGQGKALMRRAMYIELIPISTAPTMVKSMDLTLNWGIPHNDFSVSITPRELLVTQIISIMQSVMLTYNWLV